MHQRDRTQLERACKQLASWKGKAFQAPIQAEMHCYRDTSDSAFGATSSGVGEVFGFLTDSDLNLHINAKQFNAAIFAL